MNSSRSQIKSSIQFFMISPEVAGGLGEDTELDSSVHPLKVTKLNYEFDGWLGDDILESFPCYIVTERLKKELESLSPSGVKFGDVKISKSQIFDEIYPDKKLPKFYWLKIHGKAKFDDFGMNKKNLLVVSARVLDVIKKFCLNNCEIVLET